MNFIHLPQIHKLGEALARGAPALVKHHPLLRQQLGLLDRVRAPRAPRPLVPPDRAVRRQHAVARHVRRERVAAHRGADGAGAAAAPAVAAEERGERGVGGPAAGRDGEEGAVDEAAEGGEGRVGGDAAEGSGHEGGVEVGGGLVLYLGLCRGGGWSGRRRGP